MAYNLLDLRARVRTKIKDQSYPAATIDGFIDDAICEIADLYPFKQFQKTIEGNIAQGEYTFEQQDDHQSTIRLVLIDSSNRTRYWDITKWRMNSDEFFDIYPVPDVNGPATPSYWTEYGDQIYFNCVLDRGYILRQSYQKIPTEMNGDSSVPELPRNFREHIVLGASYRCEQERQNYDIAAVLEQKFQDRVSDLITRFANDSLAGPDTVIRPRRSYDYQ